MNKYMILVVEDDAAIRKLIVTTLETQGYRYKTAVSGKEALMEAATHNPDILLLDLGLPDLDGVDIIRKIRTWSTMPIIVVSARSEDSDKIEALDAGADDYLTKPFAMQELLARIRAMTRRKTDFSPNVQEFGGLTLNRETFELGYGKQRVCLGNKEFQLLELLMRSPGRLISTEQFMEQIWGYDSDVELNVVWVYISYLRKKLLNLGAPVEIRAVRGVGYKLEGREAESQQ